jgi:hypothetical protein
LIVREKSLPKAMLAAGLTLMKLGGGIYQPVVAVGDAFEEEKAEDKAGIPLRIR